MDIQKAQTLMDQRRDTSHRYYLRQQKELALTDEKTEERAAKVLASYEKQLIRQREQRRAKNGIRPVGRPRKTDNLEMMEKRLEGVRKIFY